MARMDGGAQGGVDTAQLNCSDHKSTQRISSLSRFEMASAGKPPIVTSVPGVTHWASVARHAAQNVLKLRVPR